MKNVEELILLLAQIIVALIVTISALYVILSASYADDDKKWAFAIIGIIIGYLLNKTIHR